MRLGFFLPQVGPAASTDALVRVAQRAEELDFGTVWVTERLLFPLNPQTPYGGTPDGSLPEVYKTVFDPVEALTYVAAKTSRIGLGTSVLDIPYYNPVMLARRLTTLDVLSGGRLRVGLGLGWSKDEHEATNVSLKGRGELADEFITVLKKVWTTDPVEHKGKRFQIAKSIIQPKPVQKPHPPVYLAAFSPAGFRRVAAMANGWHPVGMPAGAVRQMLDSIRTMAKEAGRNPDEIQVIYRANMMITGQPLGEDRWGFSGSPDQIKEDIAAVKELGVLELCFDPTFSPAGQTVDGFLRSMEKVRELAG